MLVVAAAIMPAQPARAGDVETIYEAHAAFIRAFNEGDVDKAFSFLTDDFVALVEAVPTKDKEGYRAMVIPFLERNKPAFEFRVEEAVVAGPWAFERLRYFGTVTPRSGGEARATSWRAVAIWRREPAGWKVARYIRTPDPPPKSP